MKIRNGYVSNSSSSSFVLSYNPIFFGNIQAFIEDYSPGCESVVYDLDKLNENMPDILISKYAILNATYKDGDTINKVALEDNEITGTLIFDNKTKNFSFKPFTIRIYFEWYEGENETMNDEADTEIAKDALLNNTKLQIEATVKFEQNVTATQETNEVENTENETTE